MPCLDRRKWLRRKWLEAHRPSQNRDLGSSRESGKLSSRWPLIVPDRVRLAADLVPLPGPATIAEALHKAKRNAKRMRG